MLACKLSCDTHLHWEFLTKYHFSVECYCLLWWLQWYSLRFMIWFEPNKTVSIDFTCWFKNKLMFFFCYLVEEKNALLSAFSVYSNGKKLFDCKRSKNPNTMECLDGIRMFSALWVIYGHAHIMSFFGPTSNLAHLSDVNTVI